MQPSKLKAPFLEQFTDDWEAVEAFARQEGHQG
jgi:hypothetical protein